MNITTCERLLDVDAVDDLKKKVIKDFEKYIKQIFKGYSPDYHQILNEINFIETYSDIDNQKLIYEYYRNLII